MNYECQIPIPYAAEKVKTKHSNMVFLVRRITENDKNNNVDKNLFDSLQSALGTLGSKLISNY